MCNNSRHCRRRGLEILRDLGAGETPSVETHSLCLELYQQHLTLHPAMILPSRARAALLSFVLFAGLASAACESPLPLVPNGATDHSPPTTAPTSFCKCTCFTNSTIIPLDAPSSANKPYTDHSSFLLPRLPEENGDDAQEPVEPPENDDKDRDKDKGGNGEEEGRKEYRAGNCGDCNRQFCLDYNLPICKGAGMDDVFTVCFREWPDGLCESNSSLGRVADMNENDRARFEKG